MTKLAKTVQKWANHQSQWRVKKRSKTMAKKKAAENGRKWPKWPKVPKVGQKVAAIKFKWGFYAAGPKHPDRQKFICQCTLSSHQSSVTNVAMEETGAGWGCMPQETPPTAHRGATSGTPSCTPCGWRRPQRPWGRPAACSNPASLGIAGSAQRGERRNRSSVRIFGSKSNYESI